MAQDYKNERKRELFNAEGTRLKEALEAKISEGANFADAATALGLENQDFASFEYGTPPSGLDRSALEQASRLEVGQISEMITTRNQTGLFVYLKKKRRPKLLRMMKITPRQRNGCSATQPSLETDPNQRTNQSR